MHIADEGKFGRQDRTAERLIQLRSNVISDEIELFSFQGDEKKSFKCEWRGISIDLGCFSALQTHESTDSIGETT